MSRSASGSGPIVHRADPLPRSMRAFVVLLVAAFIVVSLSGCTQYRALHIRQLEVDEEGIVIDPAHVHESAPALGAALDAARRDGSSHIDDPKEVDEALRYLRDQVGEHAGSWVVRYIGDGFQIDLAVT